jgi:hypothetical protein
MAQCDVCGDWLDVDSYTVQITEKIGMSGSNFKSYDMCMRCGGVVSNGIASRQKRYTQRGPVALR